MCFVCVMHNESATLLRGTQNMFKSTNPFILCTIQVQNYPPYGISSFNHVLVDGINK